MGEQGVALDLKKGGLHLSRPVRDEHLSTRGEALRAADVTVCPHYDDWSMLRVQPQAAYAQHRLEGRPRFCIGKRHRSKA